ncbi:hypothetical protein TOPH_05502, partial [Tolypocladium ophioglossoides CBS 100239]
HRQRSIAKEASKKHHQAPGQRLFSTSRRPHHHAPIAPDRRHVEQVRLYQDAQGGALPVLPDGGAQRGRAVLPDARVPDDEEEQPPDPHHAARGRRHAAPGLRPLRVWQREAAVAGGPVGQADRGHSHRARQERGVRAVIYGDGHGSVYMELNKDCTTTGCTIDPHGFPLLL